MDTTQTIEGRRAVKEALEAGRPIDKIFILRGGSGFAEIKRLARERGAVAAECDRAKLDMMSETKAHQGVIAVIAAREYAELGDIWRKAEQSGRPPLIVVCDGVEDPRNLGAIIRNAECAGAHGVVIAKRRSAGLTPACAKAAVGALEHLPVVRVPNIPALLNELKQRGVWIYGAESGGGAKSVYDADFSGGAALVLGSEGFGLGRLVKETCDMLVHIPMYGATPSLNVSAACAVILFEIAKQRG